MADFPQEKKLPIPDPDSPISAANSRRASVDTLDIPAASPSPLPSAAQTSAPTSSKIHPTSPNPGPSSTPQAPPPAYTPTAAPSSSSSSSQHIPTLTSPFDFPSALPPYPGDNKQSPVPHPLAIPQLTPSPTSPFLPAYPPSLLSLGIPSETWLSFLSTLSAFLAATISSQALSHASDIGRDVAAAPTRLGRDLAALSVSHAKQIGAHARRGNVPGVVFGALGLAVGSVGHTVGAVVGLPRSAVGAVGQRPKTPRERAEAYVAAANGGWLEQRGLRARVMGTEELAGLRGVGVEGILEAAGEGGNAGKVVEGLRGVIGEVRVDDKTISKVGRVEIGRGTLWLVVIPIRE